MSGQVASGPVNVTEFLDLERVDEMRWRFVVTDRLLTPGQFLYGGCGLAAGIVALEEASERPTVYAAAHYLSFAPPNAEVLIDVDLAAVGHRVTQARASARVDGREVLTVNAALGRGELEAPEPWTTMPDVPTPEASPPRVLIRRVGPSIFDYLETRVAIGRPFDELDGSSGSPVSAMWARLPDHLDPSAATLAIVGDLVSGGTMQPLGRRVMGRSLDNTLRVVALEPTEWVLIDIHMHALRGGFAQGTGFLWSRSGTLLATASQSMSPRFLEETLP